MKLLIDMNLSPEWIAVLQESGFEAIHWSSFGDSKTTDAEILAWAKSNGHVVFTHDLDFGAILASTRADSRSVFQIRIQDVTLSTSGNWLSWSSSSSNQNSPKAP